MNVSMRQFSEMADQIVDEIPSHLLEELNGGISVVAETKRSGSFLVMGEYIRHGMLGSIVLLYYGSFAELLGDAAIDSWRHELRSTIRHELRHHLETSAGIDDLVQEENRERAQWKAKNKLRSRTGGPDESKD